METRNYETVFIANPTALEPKLQEIKSRNQQIIERFHGKILHLDDWGKKKLAYQIGKEAKGHYFCLTYSASNECVAELERNLRINEDVYRFLTVKLDEKADPMAAIAAYKLRQEAHAKREKERAERDAERNAERAERGERGGFRAGPHRGPPRDDHRERPSVKEDVPAVEPDLEGEEE